MSQYKIEFDELSWESPMKGLRFKAITRDGQRLRLVEYTQDMAPHWCEKGHVGYILKGEFEIRFDRETVILETGDGLFIPSGPEHRHMGRAITDIVQAVFVEEG